jgi:hypothetical protein
MSPPPRPQTAPFSRRFAGFSAGRLQGPMPPPLGHAPQPECPDPSPLLKELPVAVITNPFPKEFLMMLICGCLVDAQAGSACMCTTHADGRHLRKKARMMGVYVLLCCS